MEGLIHGGAYFWNFTVSCYEIGRQLQYTVYSLASSSSFFNFFEMNTSEQHKATQGSCLRDLFLRPVVGLLGLLTVGQRWGS